MRNTSKFLWHLFRCFMDWANGDPVDWLIIIGDRWSCCNCKKKKTVLLYAYVFNSKLCLIKIVFRCLLWEEVNWQNALNHFLWKKKLCHHINRKRSDLFFSTIRTKGLTWALLLRWSSVQTSSISCTFSADIMLSLKSSVKSFHILSIDEPLPGPAFTYPWRKSCHDYFFASRDASFCHLLFLQLILCY